MVKGGPVRVLRLLVLGGLLLAGPSVGWAADQALDPAQVEAARTPDQHAALARHFRARAAEAKQLAEASLALGKAYAKTNSSDRTAQAALCQQLATEYEELTHYYEALAETEEAASQH